MSADIRIDALLPAEMATRAEYLGVRKAEMPLLTMFTLAILAGAFIALGAIFATTVGAGSMLVKSPNGTLDLTVSLTFGLVKLLSGFVFCVGLILVIVGGAELFTGNNLIVMAWAGGKVSTSALLRNWIVVYAGNFVGAVGTALMLFISKQYTFGGGVVGSSALAIANGKVQLGFLQAVALGVLCNALVCLAVWMTFSARSTIDKIAAIIFPITAFVASGFEHSIANMYFIPIGLLIKNLDPEFTQYVIANTGIDLSNLSWNAFWLKNLLPVTLGNIIGGAVFVAAVYWSVFLRRRS